MKEILIFGGTTEGRRLSEILSKEKIKHTLCVATKYGEEVLESTPYLNVNCERMDEKEMREFLIKNEFAACFDATHPYAKEVTANIKEASAETGILYFRIRRDISGKEASNLCFFDDVKSAAYALKECEGNILLTTGSKELPLFAEEGLKDRIYARVIPGEESIRICEECGIKGSHIIAMQGPFSQGLNEALIDEYNISVMVTKQSGNVGGYDEKIKAALSRGINVFVIGCDSEEGISLKEALKEIGNIAGREINAKKTINIKLAGIGPGDKTNMTEEVRKALNSSDIYLGADRMLENVKKGAECYPYYKASQIIPFIEEIAEKDSLKDETDIAVLFSGDTGFYSGAASLYTELEKLKDKSGADINIEILPGLSSLSYMCAKLGLAYEDFNILSLHGKEVDNLLRRIESSKATFLLLSGVKDVNRIGRILVEGNLSGCEIILGYRLSYEDEKIGKVTAKECVELTKEGLYSCVIINPSFAKRSLTAGIPDDEFIRGKVPMSKEEIRKVSISKLGLKSDSILLDIGSGTGSVAVECAALSDDIKVYAIECKDDAIELIKANKEKFALENIEVIKALAPEGLKDLPKATHAFVGGSRGNLKEILMTLKDINPDMKVVINAISLETIAEINSVLKEFEGVKSDIVQIQISKSDEVGSYHLMKAQNPVYICTLSFR